MGLVASQPELIVVVLVTCPFTGTPVHLEMDQTVLELLLY